MKKSIYTIALSTLLTGSIITGCKSSTDKIEDAKEEVVTATEDLNEAKQNLNQEYADFKYESEQKISDNDKYIAELKMNTAKLNKQAKEDYEKQIADLEAKNESMKQKISTYKNEEDINKWESFKREFNHDMDELGTSLKDLTKNNVK